jgi:hypothetical protein
VLTNRSLSEAHLAERWEALGRRPLPFETSYPGLFAVGDVRAGSIKRVAAAVGEGSAAVRSVHEYLAFAHGAPTTRPYRLSTHMGCGPHRDRRSSLLDGDELVPTPISAFQ